MRYFSLCFNIMAEAGCCAPEEVSMAAAFRSLPRKDSFSRGCFIFPCAVEEGELSLAAIASRKTAEKVRTAASSLVSKLSLEASDCYISEISASEFLEYVEEASCNGFVDRSTDVFRSFGLTDPYNTSFTRLECDEYFTRRMTVRTIREKAKAMVSFPELGREVERILSSKSSASPVSPVHYIIASASASAAREAEETLFSALERKGRLSSNRVARVEIPASASFWAKEMERFLEYQAGGTVVYSGYDSRLPELIRKSCLQTLSVLETGPSGIGRAKACFGALPVVVIKEERVSASVASSVLEEKARKSFPSLADYPRLDEDRDYTSEEMEEEYRTWHYRHLCSDVHPEYRALIADRGQSEGNGVSALDELEGLVGLDGVKSQIREIVECAQYGKFLESKGIESRPVSMHMAFTGNPGTAKTTVARLLGRIMNEAGLLPEGSFVEAGRADLVGPYVGSTAPLVRKAFDKARGGVLFIDEAYSLVDDRQGLFGDEAINTIVQEMENRREDTVVIFAGYPGKMECFLKRNPGLSSRIQFHVSFPDYTAEELMAILSQIAGREGFTLSAGAEDKARAVIGSSIRQPGFGNGRFARNLFERAKLKAAGRLLKARDTSQVLEAEDFSVPAGKEERKTGFSL